MDTHTHTHTHTQTNTHLLKQTYIQSQSVRTEQKSCHSQVGQLSPSFSITEWINTGVEYRDSKVDLLRSGHQEILSFQADWDQARGRRGGEGKERRGKRKGKRWWRTDGGKEGRVEGFRRGL